MRFAPISSIVVSAASGYWGQTPGTSETDTYVVRNGDVTAAGTIRWAGLPRRGMRDAEVARARLRQGDLVLTTSGDCGFVGFVRREPAEPTCATNFVRLLRLDRESVDPGYFFHYVNRSEFRASLRPYIRGTTMKNLAVGTAFDRLTIPLPSMAEQGRIEDILDRADALRAKRRLAQDQFGVLAQSVFVDTFGDPIQNPLDWPRVSLEDCATQVTDGEHATPQRTTSGIKLLSARNVRDGFIDFGDVDFIGPDEYERIRRRCEPTRGDVLISCSGSIGRVAPVETDEPFALVRSAALVRPDPGAVRTQFLHYMLRTRSVQTQMARSANASSQANLFQRQIRDLQILCPPLGRQEDFEHRVRAIDRLRTVVEASLAQLDALFASLQHRAFRGEL